jgi:probable rRNA maturation factor
MTWRARVVAVAVQKATRAAGVPPAVRVKRWALAALERKARGELTVRVVGRGESAALNARYRGKRGPTNVLSFPAGGGEAGTAKSRELLPLGDVVICASVVAREAREQGKTLAAHWAHMVVHGTLHLQGYDHENARDAKVMEARERALLRALGFPDPYSIK